jgi:hypothetical protein
VLPVRSGFEHLDAVAKRLGRNCLLVEDSCRNLRFVPEQRLTDSEIAVVRLNDRSCQRSGGQRRASSTARPNASGMRLHMHFVVPST